MERQQMIISTLSLNTDRARDYLQQLCNHFAKRVPVENDTDTARVILPIGTCDLAASQTAISAQILTCSDHVDRMEEVFGGWIERFAFRENPNLTWHRATAQTGK